MNTEGVVEMPLDEAVHRAGVRLTAEEARVAADRSVIVPGRLALPSGAAIAQHWPKRGDAATGASVCA